MRSAPMRLRAKDNRRITAAQTSTDQHYNTPEHRTWRARVINRAHGVCQRCKQPVPHGHRLFADHIIELRDGGAPHDPNNGQALCYRCHSVKTLEAIAARLRQ